MTVDICATPVWTTGQRLDAAAQVNRRHLFVCSGNQAELEHRGFQCEPFADILAFRRCIEGVDVDVFIGNLEGKTHACRARLHGSQQIFVCAVFCGGTLDRRHQLPLRSVTGNGMDPAAIRTLALAVEQGFVIEFV